jgi:hypothetical protein
MKTQYYATLPDDSNRMVVIRRKNNLIRATDTLKNATKFDSIESLLEAIAATGTGMRIEVQPLN